METMMTRVMRPSVKRTIGKPVVIVKAFNVVMIMNI
jgi:hypothetical protein